VNLMTKDEAQTVLDLMMKDEPMHPDLVPWLMKVGQAQMLNHPLVQELFVNPAKCALINARYAAKQEALAVALKERNLYRYVWLHERPYRFQAFQDLVREHELTDQEYWSMVEAVWTDSENIWQHKQDWMKLWSSDRPGRIEYAMDDEERAVYHALPNKVEVFRGCNGVPYDRRGLSWTLDFKKAQWFARRYKGLNIVVRGFVKKENIRAYFRGRNESEIVAIKVTVKHGNWST
jgi:hypothetical protein